MNPVVFQADVDRVVGALGQGACTMSQLIKRLGLAEGHPAVYRTLRWLQDAGAVRVRQDDELRMFELVTGEN